MYYTKATKRRSTLKPVILFDTFGTLVNIQYDYLKDYRHKPYRDVIFDVSEIEPHPNTWECLLALRKEYEVGLLSNGHSSTLKSLRLPVLDHYIGGENAKAYKPDPQVYIKAIEYLGGRKPFLIAAHQFDLDAALENGFCGTWYWERYAPGTDNTVILDLASKIEEVLNG